MGVFSDDSTGKSKIGEAKARNRVLVGIFVIGLCVGVIIAERAYVSKGAKINNRARTLYSTLKDKVHHAGQVAAAGGGQSQSHASIASTVFGANVDGVARNDLEALLMKIAPNKEVLVAVANKNTLWDGMLGTFLKGVRASNVLNHLILALDEETKKWCDENNTNAYLLNLTVAKAQQGTGDNHAVSAMKFGILRRFIELGYAVLLSDVDVCIFKNPFDNLYRDSDVEGMTDGFDERTAYGSIEGFDDPSMGWGRYAQFYKHFNLNSGFFYLLATERVHNLLVRLDDRLTKTKYWDQTAYNEEIFFLSHGSYKSPQVSVRVMELHKFMNSKFLFKDVRQRNKWDRPELPVIVHINYHPDKHERMKAVIRYYTDKDETALDSFPGGSEKGSRR